MAERNFDEGYDLNGTGHTFTLGGKTFRTLSTSTAAAYLGLSENRGFAGTLAFLRKMIVPDDLPDFEDLLRSEGVTVTARQVDDIAVWLLEVAAGRPTQAPGP